MGSSERISQGFDRESSQRQDDYGNMIVPEMWCANSGPIEMEYIRGTPWCLYFKKMGNAEKSVNIRLHGQFAKKSLIPIDAVEVFVSQLVCAKKKNVWFRGFVSKDLSHHKVLVFDVDRADFEEIDRASLYEWPQLIKSIPPQIVLCSLVPDDSFSQDLWCKDLQSHFMMTMLECTFAVELVHCLSYCQDQICEKGFEGLRFYASVQGMSNFYSGIVDFNIWLLERLLPEVQENPKAERSGEEYLRTLRQANPFKPALETVSNLQIEAPESKETNHEFPCIQENCNAYIELDQPEDEDDSFLDFHNMYQPREHDYCHLHSKLGFCPKPLCEKKHPPRSSRWTEDHIATEMDLFNYANLPLSGSTVKVKVLSVVSSRAIYVDLIDTKYSDIGEMSGRYETFHLLDDSLNDMKNCLKFSCLKVLPCIGELVIALDPEDERFKRGRVINFSEYLCTVFLIDFGTENKREIEQLDAHPSKVLAFATTVTLSKAS